MYGNYRRFDALPVGQIPVASTTRNPWNLKDSKGLLFYLFASILQLGQHLGQQKRNVLHLANQKEQNMATIYERLMVMMLMMLGG